jgi:uncharacterized protein (TIGR02300 family)
MYAPPGDPAVLLARQRTLHEDISMSTASERTKALRGTKRVCTTCRVRFYDLARNPIVCPSCGAHYTPATQPVIEARAAPFTAKTGWRSRPFTRPEGPVAELELASRAVEVGDAVDEPASAGVEDDIDVLEQEQDDAEASGLTDLDAPKAIE